ncbi:ChaN family lipoprotein [Ramlibacter alkalitolerans]|uniref:ChaN family lipoprotein n=1 Tax=Ramlibacter alkalitolerans TaxID=2039631 RepID=A0ABS1JPJ6_9BURK|nr:ChaN family lipoprotein [Ramlibacter alkalitolerans]MBL0425460.1 ChaN family lipoprotein [Ramlibacter alkalitolerans]
MRLISLAAALLLAGCATLGPVPETQGIDAVLIGEQHDAEAHARIQERWVSTLAQRGQLGAVALEMAERGTSTAGLPRSASEEQVREALKWNKGTGWPWARYGPAIMAAVRAGVPVVGGNLSREQMRDAMKDDTLDVLLPGPALKAQQQAIRRGHCDMLPETQVQPMTRVQIARDLSMARTISSSTAPGKTVLLLAGSGHVLPDLGVPQHLPAKLVARSVLLPSQDTGRDYCQEFKQQQEQHRARPQAAG